MRQALLYALALCFALPCASQTSWHETYGGGTNDELMGVVYTDNGFVSAGYFGGFINLGTESFFSSGSSDVMVLRHDEDGGLDWAKSFGGAVNERAVAVDVDDAGNL